MNVSYSKIHIEKASGLIRQLTHACMDYHRREFDTKIDRLPRCLAGLSHFPCRVAQKPPELPWDYRQQCR